MQLNPAEISELIKTRIEGSTGNTNVRNQGTVISVTDGICRIHGLSDVMQGEMLEFPNNTFGLALNLERDSVGSVILGEYEHISESDTVKCTGRILQVPVGPEPVPSREAHRAAIEEGDDATGSLEQIERLLYRLLEQLRARRGRHALRVALEQRILQALAQARQRVADRGLREIELVGRPGDAAFAVHRVEDQQQVRREPLRVRVVDGQLGADIDAPRLALEEVRQLVERALAGIPVEVALGR